MVKRLTEQNKVYLRIAGIALGFLLSLVGVVLYKAIWAKVICFVIAGFLGYILFRTYLSFKRKKYYMEAKVLSVVKPKNKFGVGKTVIVVKSGKISKKLFSWQGVTMKVGQNYAIYYEEKSNQIIKYDVLKMNMVARPKRSNIPPQYR